MQVLAANVAQDRRAKAVVCERRAELHGPNTSHGMAYIREARYWRAAAELADRGDTRPRPAIHQTEERDSGSVWALVFRARAHVGGADCLAVETFSEFTLAHEWGRLHAAELNGADASRRAQP